MGHGPHNYTSPWSHDQLAGVYYSMLIEKLVPSFGQRVSSLRTWDQSAENGQEVQMMAAESLDMRRGVFFLQWHPGAHGYGRNIADSSSMSEVQGSLKRDLCEGRDDGPSETIDSHLFHGWTIF